MVYTYRIAGVTLRFDSPIPLTDHAESTLFRVADEEVPDWSCRLSTAGALPSESGELLMKAPLYSWYRNGDRIRLYTNSVRDGQSIGVLEQQPGSAEASLLCLDSSRSYFSYVSQLWSAVDLPYQLLRFGALTVHSSSVAWKGRAILFSAASRVGKSTQADLWHRLLGAEPQNGDKNSLRRQEDGWYAHGFPLCGTSGICRNYTLPVGAVVLLSQSTENRLRRLTPREAVPLLIRNSFGCIQIPGCMHRMVDTVIDLAASVPVYRLACTPDERAVNLLRDELDKGGWTE